MSKIIEHYKIVEIETETSMSREKHLSQNILRKHKSSKFSAKWEELKGRKPRYESKDAQKWGTSPHFPWEILEENRTKKKLKATWEDLKRRKLGSESLNDQAGENWKERSKKPFTQRF